MCVEAPLDGVKTFSTFCDFDFNKAGTRHLAKNVNPPLETKVKVGRFCQWTGNALLSEINKDSSRRLGDLEASPLLLAKCQK